MPADVATVVGARPGHAGHLVLHPGLRGAGAQAAGAAAVGAGVAGRRPGAGPDRDTGQAGGLAAVQVHNLVVQLFGGDPRAGRGVMTDEELRDLVAGQPGAERRRAAHRRAKSSTRASARSARCWCRGPRWSSCPPPCRSREAAEIVGARPVLPVPGLPGVLRRRDRLRARPGPVRSAAARATAPGRRGAPAGEVPADQQDRAVRAVGDAPGPRAPGHRDRRVRRHRRHRHPGGPGRGADRGHPGRVRRRRGPAPAAATAASSRSTGC